MIAATEGTFPGTEDTLSTIVGQRARSFRSRRVFRERE